MGIKQFYKLLFASRIKLPITEVRDAFNRFDVEQSGNLDAVTFKNIILSEDKSEWNQVYNLKMMQTHLYDPQFNKKVGYEDISDDENMDEFKNGGSGGSKNRNKNKRKQISEDDEDDSDDFGAKNKKRKNRHDSEEDDDDDEDMNSDYNSDESTGGKKK